jgi:hypothetical protein
MSTTDSRSPQDAPPSSGSVTRLDSRMARYMARRDDLALRWAEAMAHGGPGGALFAQLVHVEDIIATHWPTVWRSHAPTWAVRDSRLVHSDVTPTTACPTCRAQAAPDAA